MSAIWFMTLNDLSIGSTGRQGGASLAWRGSIIRALQNKCATDLSSKISKVSGSTKRYSLSSVNARSIKTPLRDSCDSFIFWRGNWYRAKMSQSSNFSATDLLSTGLFVKTRFSSRSRLSQLIRKKILVRLKFWIKFMISYLTLASRRS